MSVAQRWTPLLCLVVAVGCTPTDQTPLVAFGQGTQVGTWASSAAGHSGALPHTAGASSVPVQVAPLTGAAGVTAAPVVPAAPSVGPGSLQPTAAGSGVPAIRPPSAAGGPAPIGAGAAAPVSGLPVAGTLAGAAGSGSAGSGPASGGMVTSLAFDVTTAPAGGRYQPRNVGAIWIEDSSGTLVKSLQVWAGIRRIWLTRYGSVLGFGAVDVMASATLTSHKAHHVTWDLKDTSGKAVTPGKYTLMMELTDSDASGRTNMIQFDTSAGTMTMMPPNAPSFTMMNLQLQ